jgi:hypothetical protein
VWFIYDGITAHFGIDEWKFLIYVFSARRIGRHAHPTPLLPARCVMKRV